MSKPVFLLAFSQDPDATLPEVINELNQIQRLLSDTPGQPDVLWRVTQADMESALNRHSHELRIVHYCGHAGPNALALNAGNGTSQMTFASGLAGLAGMASTLKLVFLNGRSTQDQAELFIKHGIPAVIATSKPLADQYAVEFARRFYTEFTKPNSRRSLRQAFDAAFYSFTGEHGSLTKAMLDERTRGSFDLDEDSDEPLYDLYINPAKKSVEQERFSEWMDLKATPDTKALKKALQDLISKARLEEALDELAKVSSEAIQLKAQWATVKRDNMRGLLTEDEWFRRQNQINSRILDLIEQL